MIGLRLGVTATAVLFSTLSYAAHSGSVEDQLACTPDVYRLCAAQMPDEDAIVACLTHNKALLSPACGRVFARPAQGGVAQPLPPPAGDDD